MQLVSGKVQFNACQAGADLSSLGGGGGGCKRYVPPTHITNANPEVPYTAEVQGPLQGPVSSRFFVYSLGLPEPCF